MFRIEQSREAESEGAEGWIVTGFEIGKAPKPEKVKEFTDSVNIPVILGSGTTKENTRTFKV